MKHLLAFLTVCLVSTNLFAQKDSTKTQTDTIRIGGMVIIKKDSPGQKRETTVRVGEGSRQKHSNVSTSDLVLDIGFANWTDKTDYASATTQGYLVNRPGSSALSSNDFKLKTGKSSNVNLWFFFQRINLIDHYVNLKYGLGLEMNNYRFKSDITFNDGGMNPYNRAQNINHPFVFRDSVAFSKDKLSADYLTIPFMLNIQTNPDHPSKGLSFSAGVSIGYRYSTRNKQISNEHGKIKNHGDFDIEKWKFAYVGELGLGPVRLFGSYSPNSIFDNVFKFMPYSVGVRLSNW
jgi:hypothetical protein